MQCFTFIQKFKAQLLTIQSPINQQVQFRRIFFRTPNKQEQSDWIKIYYYLQERILG
ncbi:hypothetical protein pb186bvf_012496 [Paramecium bursaria]